MQRGSQWADVWGNFATGKHLLALFLLELIKIINSLTFLKKNKTSEIPHVNYRCNVVREFLS